MLAGARAGSAVIVNTAAALRKLVGGTDADALLTGVHTAGDPLAAAPRRVRALRCRVARAGRALRGPRGCPLGGGAGLLGAARPCAPRRRAVITDVGVPLSHAAIVARDLGIPAVVGCGDATSRLRTGARVRVDGARGTVETLAPPGNVAS